MRAFLPADEQWQISHLSPYVRLSGDEWRKPWTIGERKLLDFLLVYIAEGDGTFTVAGKTFGVTTGDLVWIPPDTLHTMSGRSATMHVSWVHFDLVFSPSRSGWKWYIPAGTRDLRAWKLLIHPPVADAQISAWKGQMQLPNHAVIGNLIQRVCFEHLFGGKNASLLLSGLMIQIMAEIKRGMAMRNRSRKNLRWGQMQDALAFIQQHAAGKLPLAELARRAGLSPSHFRKTFRETHGKSPRALHRLARIQRGRDLLTSTTITISEIAAQLDFATMHNFTRAFTAIHGVAPSRYRQGGSPKVSCKQKGPHASARPHLSQ